MRYIDEFRDKSIISGLSKKINTLLDRLKKDVFFMEVCGTHTMSIYRNGINKILDSNLKLLSGPGCPVCVTTDDYIDTAIEYAKLKDVIIATFGDMVRVPGSVSTLEGQNACGSKVEVVYSPQDALVIAQKNADKKIIFLAVGFETTAPTVAATIREAKARAVGNFFVFCAHKLVPPAMKTLLDNDNSAIDGFICPGHVSAIIGSTPYNFIAKDYRIPCVIAGFEPLDILEAVYMLLGQLHNGEALVQIQYKRAVKEEGNRKAQDLMYDVFKTTDAPWRGLGSIKDSGLKLKDKYCGYDAEKVFGKVSLPKKKETDNCLCANVLKGISVPGDCKLFAGICTPANPKGPCMVSSEGTCAAYYKYNRL